MQSGIDSSRLSIMAETVMASRAAQTAATDATEIADASSSTSAAPVQQVSVGVKNPTKTNTACASGTNCNKGFFGPQGPSFRDALDAINPLNQIPIVSDILASVTGHEPSTASKLAGGAIAAVIGGPISIVASLASVIFESGAGKTPANALYAAIAGDDSAAAIQVAKVDTAVEPVDAMELASLEPAAVAPANDGAYEAVQKDVAKAVANSNSSNSVLDLYGASDASAHASYKKAQLLPYLRDVNHSKIL